MVWGLKTLFSQLLIQKLCWISRFAQVIQLRNITKNISEIMRNLKITIISILNNIIQLGLGNNYNTKKQFINTVSQGLQTLW